MLTIVDDKQRGKFLLYQGEYDMLIEVDSITEILDTKGLTVVKYKDSEGFTSSAGLCKPEEYTKEDIEKLIAES